MHWTYLHIMLCSLFNFVIYLIGLFLIYSIHIYVSNVIN